METLFTKKVVIEGVPLVFPLGYNPPDKLSDFPSACGAGKWGDYLVPEKPVTVSFSPACNSHDACFKMFPPQLQFFTLGNEIFRDNLNSLIRCKERISWVRELNSLAAELYMGPVSGPPGLSAWCAAQGLGHMFLEFQRELFPEIDK